MQRTPPPTSQEQNIIYHEPIDRNTLRGKFSNAELIPVDESEVSSDNDTYAVNASTTIKMPEKHEPPNASTTIKKFKKQDNEYNKVNVINNTFTEVSNSKRKSISPLQQPCRLKQKKISNWLTADPDIPKIIII